jgi:hypothetical protein
VARTIFDQIDLVARLNLLARFAALLAGIFMTPAIHARHCPHGVKAGLILPGMGDSLLLAVVKLDSCRCIFSWRLQSHSSSKERTMRKEISRILASSCQKRPETKWSAIRGRLDAFVSRDYSEK